MRFSCACAKGEDGFEVAVEAAEKVREKIGEANIVFVFSSVKYEQKEVLRGVKSVFPNASQLGCSSAGEICNGPIEGSVVVAGINCRNMLLAVGSGRGMRKNPRKAGEIAAKNALKELEKVPNEKLPECARLPSMLIEKHGFLGITFPDGLSEGEENALEGIRNVLGVGFPLIGGSAGDDLKLERTYQFANYKVLEDSIVLGILLSDIKLAYSSKSGWIPTGKAAFVSKARGRIVYELDRKKASVRYEEMLGKKVKEGIIAWEEGLSFPLAIPDLHGDLWLRHPKEVRDDGSMSFFSRIQEGTVVALTEGSPDNLIEAARMAGKEIRKELKGVSGALVFDCVARRVFLKERAEEEIQALKKALKCNIAGFYTYGEQAMTKSGMCGHRNQTITVLAFGKRA